MINNLRHGVNKLRIFKDIIVGVNLFTGHKLGGSIVTDMMTRSKSLLNNTKKGIPFNSGYTSAFHNSSKLDKDTKNK